MSSQSRMLKTLPCAWFFVLSFNFVGYLLVMLMRSDTISYEGLG